MNETIVNELPKYYVTPYTFFTVFCILWIATACCRAMAMPLKVLYGVTLGMTKGVEALIRIASKRRSDV